MTILPAQGRCYRSAEAAIEDLQNGEDFLTMKGRLITIHHFPELLTHKKRIVLFYDTINGRELDVSDIKPTDGT